MMVLTIGGNVPVPLGEQMRELGDGWDCSTHGNTSRLACIHAQPCF